MSNQIVTDIEGEGRTILVETDIGNIGERTERIYWRLRNVVGFKVTEVILFLFVALILFKRLIIVNSLFYLIFQMHLNSNNH